MSDNSLVLSSVFAVHTLDGTQLAFNPAELLAKTPVAAQSSSVAANAVQNGIPATTRDNSIA